MAIPVILVEVVKQLPRKWAGGGYGIAHIPPLADTPTGTYYICLIVMAVSVLIMWKLTDAGSRYIRTGLIFHAIREDEIAARATGVNTIRYKILAFAISGFFAGLAGALMAHVTNGASPEHFSLVTSFNAIIWVVFGGIVSIYGAVVGVFTLNPLLDFLSQQPDISPYRVLIVTVMIILILLFMPEGIAVWIRDKIERECPRCKLGNVAWRKECRACGASLH
jgi:branched-chain amino acid transport system permease protein